jgi:Hg(II)-responsive transcriptional regulator
MTLKAGEVAKKAGVNIDTIRFYEQNGLLPLPKRAGNGYRLYEKEIIDRLRFILNAKTLGFTLKEIKELLQFTNTKKVNCCEMLKLTDDKIEKVGQKIAQLQRIENALKSLHLSCKIKGTADYCPIIEALIETGEDYES